MLIWILNLLVGIAIVTGQQECKNAVFNDCIFPPSYNAIHAENIEMCADVCDVYASVGSCSMYSFDTNGFVDENCKLYDMQTPIPDFQAQCNEVGVPVNDKCIFYDDECTVTNSCPTCIACGTGTCGGYMQMDCEFQGEILERHPGIPFDTCQMLCKAEKAAYIHYYRESQNCYCMASDKRVCKKQVVKYGTNINVCNDENKASCASGDWTEDPSSGLCYHVKRTKLTWKDAHDDCLSMSDSYYNSDLVSIHSASEMQFIKNLDLSGGDEFWLGFHDIQREGLFLWSDGSSDTYHNWNDGEPNHRDGEDCVEFRENDGWAWNDQTCDEQRHHICKKTRKTGNIKPCGSGEWIEDTSTGLCYFVSEESLYWDDALFECLCLSDNDYKSDLVSVHSASEMAFIKNHVLSDNDNRIWIGFNDIKTEGSFVWTDGSSVTYTDWHDGQPNNSNGEDPHGEDCGEIREESDREWNDRECDHHSHSICKKTRRNYKTESEQK